MVVQILNVEKNVRIPGTVNFSMKNEREGKRRRYSMEATPPLRLSVPVPSTIRFMTHEVTHDKDIPPWLV